MTDSSPGPRSSAAPRGRALSLWGLLLLQSFCALFFLADAVADLLGTFHLPVGLDHDTFELLVVVALLLGIAFTSVEIRAVLHRQRRMEFQLRAASGAFAEVLEAHFEGWALTPSERDVALLAIKGFTIAEIADLRRTKEGTTKAQCNAIYRKARVSGRPLLLSLFIEELMGDGLMVAGAPLYQTASS